MSNSIRINEQNLMRYTQNIKAYIASTHLSPNFGSKNTASGLLSIVGGQNNENYGYYSCLVGRNNINNSYDSCQFGTSNINNGRYSIQAGRDNENSGLRSASFGFGLYNSNDDCTVVGKYNKDVAGNLFVIGNGKSTARSNILEVSSSKVTVNGILDTYNDLTVNADLVVTNDSTFDYVTIEDSLEINGDLSLVGTAEINRIQSTSYPLLIQTKDDNSNATNTLFLNQLATNNNEYEAGIQSQNVSLTAFDAVETKTTKSKLTLSNDGIIRFTGTTIAADIKCESIFGIGSAYKDKSYAGRYLLGVSDGNLTLQQQPNYSSAYITGKDNYSEQRVEFRTLGVVDASAAVVTVRVRNYASGGEWYGTSIIPVDQFEPVDSLDYSDMVLLRSRTDSTHEGLISELFKLAIWGGMEDDGATRYYGEFSECFQGALTGEKDVFIRILLF